MTVGDQWRSICLSYLFVFIIYLPRFFSCVTVKIHVRYVLYTLGFKLWTIEENVQSVLSRLFTTFRNCALNIRRNWWFLHNGVLNKPILLNGTFTNWRIGRDGSTAWSFVKFLFPGSFKIYRATKIDIVHDLWGKIQNGFETVRGTFDIFKRVRNSMLRRAVACVQSQGRHFDHLFLIVHNSKTKMLICSLKYGHVFLKHSICCANFFVLARKTKTRAFISDRN